MSDNTINQVFNLDSSSVDALNQKLEKTYALMQLVSQGGGANSGLSQNSAGQWINEKGQYASAANIAGRSVDVPKTIKQFAAKEGFHSNQEIGYVSSLEQGLLGANGLPISKAEYSISQYGERQQQTLNSRATQEALSSISLSRDTGYLDRRGISNVDNRIDAAAGKALLYGMEDSQRLAINSFKRSSDISNLGLKSDATDMDILERRTKLSNLNRSDQSYMEGLPLDASTTTLALARSKRRRSEFDERQANKQEREDIQSDSMESASRILGIPEDSGKRAINQARNATTEFNADLRAKKAEDRAAVAEARRTNTVNDLGDTYAPNGGAGMDQEDIVQAIGARAEARRNRASIRAEEKRVADVKVVNRGYTTRGMTGALLPDDADPEEVYAAQQDIRGMGPVPKTGAVGKVQNAWDKFQGTYGGRFARGALYAAGSSAAEYAHAMENEQMTGRPDYLSQGNAGGSAIGGIIGAGIGSIFPGYGTFIGAGVGMQLGGTIGQWSQVKNQQEMMTSLALQPTASMVNNLLGQFGTAPTQFYSRSTNSAGTVAVGDSNVINPNAQITKEMTDRSFAQRDYIGANYWRDGTDVAGRATFDKSTSTVEGMAAGYQTVYQSMINAGDNPYDYTDFPSEGTTPVQFGTRRVQKKDASGRPITHRGGHWETGSIHTYGTQQNTGTTYQQTYDRTVNPGMEGRLITTGGPMGRSTGVARQSTNQGGLSFKAVDSGYWDANTQPDSRSVSQVSSNGTNETVGWNKVWIEEDVPEYEDVPVYRNEKTNTRARKGDWIRENAEKWFGAGSDELLKKVYAPINDARHKTADNLVDIISEFGGSNAALYSQIKTPFGDKPPLDLATAIKFGAGLQDQDRAAQIAQLSVRDSGSQMLFAMDNRAALMVDPTTGVELIPGAKSSMEFAKTRQGQISAQNRTWQDYDLGHYDTQSMRLQNQERRYEVNPYSPGNRMAMELTGLGMDRDRIATLKQRESFLQGKGMLSEQQQFEMESQIEGIETNRQTRIGRLVEGVANRLPAMAAGRPSFASRIDSREMTAMQFGMIDFPYRGSGAMNDQQRSAQETFLHQFLDPAEINSRSRTFTLNNMGGSGGSSNAKPQMSSLGAPGAGMNGGHISSKVADGTVTQVSAPDIVAEIRALREIMAAALLSQGGFSKNGHPGEANGVISTLNRMSPQR